MLAIRGFIDSVKASAGSASLMEPMFAKAVRPQSASLEENRDVLQQIQPLLRELERIDREARPIEEQYDPDAIDHGFSPEDQYKLEALDDRAREKAREIIQLVDTSGLSRNPLDDFNYISNLVGDAIFNV